MSIDYNLIGQRIQKARKNANLTQENLAELMDMSVGYISQIERGSTRPTLVTIDNICTCIDCDLIYILTGKLDNSSDDLVSNFTNTFARLSESNKYITIEFMEILSKYTV